MVMRVLPFPFLSLPTRKLKPKFDAQAQKMFSLYVCILASSTLPQQHYFLLSIIAEPLNSILRGMRILIHTCISESDSNVDTDPY